MLHGERRRAVSERSSSPTGLQGSPPARNPRDSCIGRNVGTRPCSRCNQRRNAPGRPGVLASRAKNQRDLDRETLVVVGLVRHAQGFRSLRLPLVGSSDRSCIRCKGPGRSEAPNARYHPGSRARARASARSIRPSYRARPTMTPVQPRRRTARTSSRLATPPDATRVPRPRPNMRS